VTEQTKTKPPVKRWVTAPDKQLENTDKAWKERVKKMPLVQSKNNTPLPTGGKLTVGSTYGMTRKEIFESRSKKLRELHLTKKEKK